MENIFPEWTEQSFPVVINRGRSSDLFFLKALHQDL